MPAMANITVKASNGTTDVVYSALNPSSGDKVSALWRAEAAGVSSNLRPTLDMQSQWNGPRTARRITATYMYPYVFTNASTFEKSVRARIPITYSATVPVEIPDTEIAEAVAQFNNLLVSALAKDCIKLGFAPT